MYGQYDECVLRYVCKDYALSAGSNDILHLSWHHKKSMEGKTAISLVLVNVLHVFDLQVRFPQIYTYLLPIAHLVTHFCSVFYLKNSIAWRLGRSLLR